MNKPSLLTGALALWLLGAPYAWSDHSLTTMAEQIASNGAVDKPAPVFSVGHAITTEQAYQVQTLAVKKRLSGISPVGFKAGLTSKPSQEKFAVTEAVAGVLMPGGLVVAEEGRFVISARDFNKPMMEAEIGFRLGGAVSEPVADIASLKLKVATIMPVVELPDLAFVKPDEFKGVDIIANNVMTKYYITGVEVPLDEFDLDDQLIEIQKDGGIILAGNSNDAMGDQWQALLWLVNKSVANGWTIEPGQLLITGALGRMLPAKPGFYQINYGALGQVDFAVE